jgi:two-component system response regulator DegU
MFETKEIQTKVIRVLLAEDHPVTASLIKRYIEDFDICEFIGLANDGQSIVDLAVETKPDIIIMDINLPNIDGITAMQQILRKTPKTKVIMLSSHEEPWVIKRSIDNGAVGYFTKKTSLKHLMDAIDIVNTGGSYLDKNSMEIIVNSFQENKRLN